jgi:hypothetical protein
MDINDEENWEEINRNKIEKFTLNLSVKYLIFSKEFL